MIRSVLAGANPYHLRYVEVTTHGYGLIELSSTGASITYVIVKSTSKAMPGSSTLARFELDRGSAAIRQVEGSGYMPRPESPEVPGTTDSPGTPGSPGTPEAPGTSSESSGTEPGGAAGAEPVAGQPAYTG